MRVTAANRAPSHGQVPRKASSAQTLPARCPSQHARRTHRLAAAVPRQHGSGRTAAPCLASSRSGSAIPAWLQGARRPLRGWKHSVPPAPQARHRLLTAPALSSRPRPRPWRRARWDIESFRSEAALQPAELRLQIPAGKAAGSGRELPLSSPPRSFSILGVVVSRVVRAGGHFAGPRPSKNFADSLRAAARQDYSSQGAPRRAPPAILYSVRK